MGHAAGRPKSQNTGKTVVVDLCLNFKWQLLGVKLQLVEPNWTPTNGLITVGWRGIKMIKDNENNSKKPRNVT